MNVEKMCRVCLSEFDELTPLWIKLPGENKTLEETINFVVNINIKLEDGLPNKICKICESILDLADTFKKRCLESESILEQQAQEKQNDESRQKIEINYQENSETHSNDTSCLPTSISRTPITDLLRKITENDENIYDLPEYKIKMEIDELDVDSGTTICNQEHLDTIQAATKSNESCIVKEEVPEQSRYLVNKEMISCPHCSLTFQTKISYKAHIFCTHEPKDWRIFNCALCKDTFTCKDSFEAHLRTHGRQNMSDIHSKHVQNISGYSQPVTFPSEGEDTTDHAPPTEANKMDKFECFNCKEIFTSFDSIKAHLRTHTKTIKTISTKAFLCKTCDQRFSSETELMKHIQTLHNSCKESRRELPSKESLESHKLELRKDAPSPNEPKLDDMQPTTAAVRSPTEDPAAADTSTNTVIETDHDLEKNENIRITRKKRHEMNLKRNQKLEKKRNIDKSEKASTQNTATMPKQPSIKTHNKITSATEKQSTCTYKTNSNSKIHTCDICGYTTPTVKTLNAHLKAHAATKRYSCNTCGYLSINSDHYNIHMRTHTGEKPYSCEVCEKKFSVKTTLLRHVRSHTGENINNNNFNYTCEVCGKKFRHKNNLLRHVRIHTGDKAFSCNVCENKFTQKHHLVRHLRTHTGEKPYSCDVCQRKFNVKHILDRHLRTHTDGKIYSCHVCQKQFSFKWNLVAHLRTHTGEKPYSCDVCLRRFSQRQHIVMHMRTHTGEKPYSCDECEKKFNQRRYLVRHLKRHTGEKPYSCDVCLRRFSKRHHIVTHLRTHTG